MRTEQPLIDSIVEDLEEILTCSGQRADLIRGGAIAKLLLMVLSLTDDEDNIARVGEEITRIEAETVSASKWQQD